MTGYGWGFLSGYALGCLFWIADNLLTARAHRRRRGGWLRPGASSTTSPRTGERPETSSNSSLAPGHLSAGAAIRVLPDAPSSTGGPGWSIRVRDGGGGTGRTPPAPADSGSRPYYDHERDRWVGQCPHGDWCTRCDAIGYCEREHEPAGAALLRRNRGDDAA